MLSILLADEKCKNYRRHTKLEVLISIRKLTEFMQVGMLKSVQYTEKY